MNRENSVRSWIVGLGVGSLLVVLALPLTGWLVRQHLLWQVWPGGRGPAAINRVASDPLGGAQLTEGDLAKIKRTAAKHPDDFRMQLAAAVAQIGAAGSGERNLAPLEQVAERFSDEPGAYATLIRYACSDISITYPLGNAWKLTDEKKPEPHKMTEKQAAAVSLVKRYAAKGEKLEPTNAFFPMMLAYTGFTVGEPDQALQALERAGQDAKWDDYAWVEPKAGWQIRQEALGEREALERIVSAAGILFPHLAGLRNTARAATAEAMDLEMAGKPDEGLEIRRSVMRVGSLMRAQSPSLIGSLVGMASVGVSMERPAGAPAVGTDKGLLPAQKSDKAAQRFIGYLKSRGYDRFAGEVQQEQKSAKQVRKIAASVTETNIVTRPVVVLAVLWLACFLLLSVAVWLLIGSGLAALASRTKSYREGRSLERGVALSIFAGIAAGIVVLLAVAAPTTIGVRLVFVAGAAVVGLALTRLKGPASIAYSVAALATAFLLAVLIPAATATETFAAVLAMILSWGEQMSGGGIAGVLYIPAVLACILLPIGLVALAASFGRAPVSIALIRHIRRWWPVAACLLLFAYSVTAVFTGRQEAALIDGLDRITTHEGKMLADLTGQEWPGAVR